MQNASRVSCSFSAWFSRRSQEVADRVIGSAGFAKRITGQLFFLRVVQSSEPGEGRQGGRRSSDVGRYYCKATNPVTGASVVSREASLSVAGQSLSDRCKWPESFGKRPHRRVLSSLAAPTIYSLATAAAGQASWRTGRQWRHRIG